MVRRCVRGKVPLLDREMHLNWSTVKTKGLYNKCPLSNIIEDMFLPLQVNYFT